MKSTPGYEGLIFSQLCGLPALTCDGAGRVCLSLETLEHSRATNRGTIASAASYIEQLKRWITSFELGLLDKDSWEKWAGRRC